MRGQHWSEDEVSLLRKFYRLRGVAYVHKKFIERGFDRTRIAIRMKANSLGVYQDYANGDKLVPLIDAYPKAHGSHQRAHPRIIEAARRDGVLSRAEHVPKKPYLAPREWVDKFMQQVGVENRERETVLGTWLTTAQAAKAFGVPIKSLATMNSPNRTDKGYLVACVKRVERRLLCVNRDTNYTMALYWHPEQVRVAARRYQAWRSRSAWHQGKRADSRGASS